MNLTQALCQTIDNHYGPAEEVGVILRQLPAHAWRADEGQPCVLEAMLNNRGRNVAANENPRLQDRMDLMSWLFTERADPSPELCVRLVDAVLLFDAIDTDLAHRVWDLAGPRAPVAARPALLLTALTGNWPYIVKGLLDLGCPTDLSTWSLDNPFGQVRTLATFRDLVAAGFDPFQPDRNRTTGHTLLRERDTKTFHNPEERQAIVTELAVSTRAWPVRDQVALALRGNPRWKDVQASLKIIGPSWTEARTDNGGTPLHVVLNDHPEWMPQLMKRADLKTNTALWGVLNAHGEHALMNPWFRMDAQASQDWWAEFRGLDSGDVVLDTLPRAQDPADPFRALMTGALRRHKPLPNLNNPALWDLLRNMGGWDESRTREHLLANPHWQEAFERLAWNPKSRMRGTGRWSGLTDWANRPDHPWVMGFRLLEAAGGLYSETSLAGSTNLPVQHARALALCHDLVERGASWDWANDKVQNHQVEVNNRTAWMAVGSVWENRQLRRTMEDGPTDAPPRLRRRM